MLMDGVSSISHYIRVASEVGGTPPPPNLFDQITSDLILNFFIFGRFSVSFTIAFLLLIYDMTQMNSKLVLGSLEV